jgi:hypothetical protein
MKFKKNTTTSAKGIGTGADTLRESLGLSLKEKEEIQLDLPIIDEYDTVNLQGNDAYKNEDFFNLLSLLNTLKLDEDQFYRSVPKQFEAVKNAVQTCAAIDPIRTAKCIRWSRTQGAGFRTVNHIAAVYLLPYLKGQSIAKIIYGSYNKTKNKGGFVYRLDDIVQMTRAYFHINSGAKTLPKAMKIAFKDVLETANNYSLAKYRGEGLVDIINLVHPSPSIAKTWKNILKIDNHITMTEGELEKYPKLKAKIVPSTPVIDGTYSVPAISAIVHGVPFKAETHETMNSEVGQIVAKAVKSGEVSVEEGSVILKEAKSENFKKLLMEDKMGMLAIIRNLVAMIKAGVDGQTIDLVVAKITDGDNIRKTLIHPMQLDIAYEILLLSTEIMRSRGENFNNKHVMALMDALKKSYEVAMPNMVLGGKTAVFLDVSGSMTSAQTPLFYEGKKHTSHSEVSKKAALIAATFVKATGADLYMFDTKVQEKDALNAMSVAHLSVFDFADAMNFNGGGTNIGICFKHVKERNLRYDNIILLSDNEANDGCTRMPVSEYCEFNPKVNIYSIDLQSYGTSAIRGSNIKQYFGYGFEVFEQIIADQFSPEGYMSDIDAISFV